jgi:hypothetical protein
MARVTIYRFGVYDIQSDQVVTSKRWGTREAIVEIARGRVLDETAAEVDESAVASDLQGFTVRDFNPHPRIGFQTYVAR